MDVKSTFLNGDLTETVYVQQPPGFIIGDSAWNAKLDKEIIALGFERSKLEHAVYRRSSGKSFLIVGVYVDDLIISGPSV
jgi:hypothetical protein